MNCKKCDARMKHAQLGMLGHGGTEWWTCPNNCKDPEIEK